MALQGCIKSMPEYPSHIRAGVVFPREGREFIVGDDKLIEEAAKEARKLADEAAKKGVMDFASSDKPVVYHVVEEDEFTRRPRSVEKRGRLVDLPGKPLVLDELAYEYLRQGFGVHLSCEPLGGAPDPMAAHQERARLEAECARLKKRVAELEKK